MSVSKRTIVMVDQDAIIHAFQQDLSDPVIDAETLTVVAEAMTATAKAVLAAQGIELIAHSQNTQLQERKTTPTGEVVLTGQGLSSHISSHDGLARLKANAIKLPVEAWAGEVQRPSKAAELLSIRRSTLDNWRTQGEIIAIPKGKNSHVIPMSQFIEGRPIPGIDGVLAIAQGSASLAWGWLMTPHVSFDGEPPLGVLAAGDQDAVLAAAERSIG